MGSKSPPLPRGKLNVQVLEAQDTKGDEGYGVGKADPFGIIKFADLEKKTKTDYSGGSKPVWNQSFTFDLTKSDPRYNELTISLINYNSWRDDTPIGETRIDLASLVAEKGNNIPATWYPVTLNGDQYGWIYLAFDFTPTPDRNAPKKDDKSSDKSQDAAIGKSSVPSGGKTEDHSYPPIKAVPEKEDSGRDAAKDAAKSSVANNGTPEGHKESPEVKGKPKTTDYGGAGSQSPNEGKHNSQGAAVSQEDDSAQGEAEKDDAENGGENDNSNIEINGKPVPLENIESTVGEAASEIPSDDDNSQDEEDLSKGESNQVRHKKAGEETEDNGADDQGRDEDHPNRGVEKGSAESGAGGNLRNAAASILEASRGLGRKFSPKWIAVPSSLLIAFLVLATIKRKGRNIDGETSGSNAAAAFKGETWQNGMPTSSRQKILHHRIYGTDK